MAFESFGAKDIWSSQEAPNSYAALVSSGKLALAAGVGAGALYLGTRDYGEVQFNMLGQVRSVQVGRPVDHVAAYARTVGNLSPFQLGNSFRIPEFMFPFLSPKAQGLQGGQYRFDKEFLASSESLRYLERITGKPEQELRRLGLGVAGSSDAGALVYKANSKGIGGSLWVEKNGQSTILSKNIMLMSMDSEVDPFSREVHKINKATKGVLSALGVYDLEGFNVKNLFAEMNPAEGASPKTAPYLPIPSMAGRVKGMGDFLRRTTYPRGFMAFKAARFNDLLGEYAEQFFGETGKKIFTHTVGFTPQVADGPASAMLTRYAGRFAMLGAGALAVSQTDWLRRNYGFVGQTAAITATTGVAAYAAHRIGVSNKWVKAGVAASVLGQAILPGFQDGLVQGIASTAAGLSVARGSALNPFNYYRRTLEGFLPGISSWETGALVATGAMMASYAKVPFTGKRLSEHIVTAMDHPEAWGLPDYQRGASPVELLSKRDYFWREMQREQGAGIIDNSERWRTKKGRAQILENIKKNRSAYETSKMMNETWLKSERAHRDMLNNSLTEELGMNKRMLQSLERVASRYENSNDIQRLIFMNAEGAGVKAYYSFFGANPAANREMREAISKLGFKGPALGRVASVGALAFSLHQLVTGGLLGSMESSAELRDIYSGKQYIEVKKGRWWEGGGTPHGGTETKYFRPHGLALFMNRTRQRGIWGEDEDRISPIGKFIRKNFTYELERRQYYDRPYPISGAAFEDVPIIGGLLGATIGRLVKPPKLMHTDEWVRDNGFGDYEYRSVYKGSREEPAYALGADPPGVPTSPYTSAQVAKKLAYQFNDLSGIVGYATGVMRSAITGSENWENPTPVLATAGEMSSISRQFWESELGGLGFTTELWRRVFSPYERGLDKTNPIRNNMPSWMPQKFQYGDPYTKVQWGEARLPGAGYSALHKELEGVDPDDYPLLARYSILGDVAPTSYEFRQLQQTIYKRRYEGYYSKGQERLIDDVDSRVAAVVNQYSFKEMHDNAIALPGSSLTRAGWDLGKNFVRDMAAPAEYMVPMGFRPVQKLMGDYRDPIEQYEFERMYGSGGMAFWNKPWRDWFRPSVYSAAHFMGYSGKPLWRQEADEADAMFDQLEFNKWMRLAIQADQAGDGRAKNKFLWAAGQTRMGVNPQGSTLGIYWSLPEADRSFMNAFAQAQGADRDRILDMVPADQVHLYKSLWRRMDQGDPTAQMPGKSGVDENYLRQRYYNQPYQQLPPEDWIGWNAEVDMDDIKVRYADRFAADLHDYGLWEKQLVKSMNQPFLSGSDEVVRSANIVSASQVQSTLYNMLGEGGHRANVTVMPTNGPPRANFTYNDSRDLEIQAALLGMLHGY